MVLVEMLTLQQLLIPPRLSLIISQDEQRLSLGDLVDGG